MGDLTSVLRLANSNKMYLFQASLMVRKKNLNNYWNGNQQLFQVTVNGFEDLVTWHPWKHLLHNARQNEHICEHLVSSHGCILHCWTNTMYFSYFFLFLILSRVIKIQEPQYNLFYLPFPLPLSSVFDAAVIYSVEDGKSSILHTLLFQVRTRSFGTAQSWSKQCCSTKPWEK